MQLGIVVGTATSTRRHASLEGWKLLVVQLLNADGETPDGEPVLSIDHLGAGRGTKVLVTNDGQATRELVGDDQTPARWSVIGIED
jgi:ethanolamine utilization protein EutN